jgi:hypothetical protein
MTHEQAVEDKAVERFILREMTEAEEDEFIEHYFGCEECAEQVQAGAVFAENTKAVALEGAGTELLGIHAQSSPESNRPWHWFLWPRWWGK